MKTRTLFIQLLALGLAVGLASPVRSDTTQNPTLTDLDLQVDVTFTPSTGLYTYRYTIGSGLQNRGEIYLFDVDISTAGPITPAPDPDLVNDSSYRTNLAPARSVPVGLGSPSGWTTAIGVTGMVVWGASGDTPNILPGESLGGFVITSKAPPGPRRFKIAPFFDPIDIPDDAALRPELQPETYVVRGQTIGPVLATELKLIDGKGQRPTDVNTFLRYSNPTTVSTTLAPGVRKFDLVVFYGPTTVPTTFTAELNGVAITPKFHPTPGSFDVVRLDLQPGSNTLVLSVEGRRSDGRLGRDTDRLTFNVPTR